MAGVTGSSALRTASVLRKAGGGVVRARGIAMLAGALARVVCLSR